MHTLRMTLDLNKFIVARLGGEWGRYIFSKGLADLLLKMQFKFSA